MTATRRNTDLADVLTQDHQTLESVCYELETSVTTPEHRRQLADHLITEVVRHTVVEHRYLYQAIGADGDGTLAEAERTMSELENRSPADPDFELLVNKLITGVRRHIGEVESRVLPALGTSLTERERTELGEKVLAANEIAPRAPHPAAPDAPAAGLLLDPGARLIEEVKKALGK
ncbi:hemerythrin domain-containing protein [Kibdelosporangium persicum]|nr:hemerythrin domain-containing protein [Kibdelosporangium persicum]